MTSYAFSIVITFHKWACHLTNVEKQSKTFISPDSSKFFEKSTNMRLITTLVQEY